MVSAGLVNKAEKQLSEQQMQAFRLSETGADQAINIVKNTKAPSDLNPPKESDPNQIRKID